MKFKKIITMALAGTLALSLLSGCGSSNKGDDSSSGESTTKIYKDVKGEVEIPKNPERIVDLTGISEALVILGNTPVGSASIDSYNVEEFPIYMKEDMKDVTVVGHSMADTMDMEAIISLEPDLIIMTDRQEKIYEELKEIAPTIEISNDADDWKARLLDMGEIVGKEEAAKKWIKDYEKKADDLSKEVKSEVGDATYMSVFPFNGQFYIYSASGVGDLIYNDLNLAKPENLPVQESITIPSVSLEALSEIESDYLIMLANESDMEELKSSAVWNNLKAVKNNKVIRYDLSPYFTKCYNPIGKLEMIEELRNSIIENK